MLILLIDLAANGHLGTSTRLRFLTGKGKIYIVIDIRDRVSVIGADKTKGLIGLHDLQAQIGLENLLECQRRH